MRNFLGKPFTDRQTDWREAEIVSLDFETTGLDPRKDQIISLGLVIMQQGAIQLGTAWHEIVRVDQPVPASSAIIHRITDDQTSSGRPLTEVLPELLETLSGRIMLVHFGRIEQGFLNAACQRLYGSPFLLPTIDTLVLAERIYSRNNPAINPHRLRLFNLREDYNLPRYQAHNALNDALSTAELFMAMAYEIVPRGHASLKNFINQ
jgi:DNA polymerase-3 subunit epsilon